MLHEMLPTKGGNCIFLYTPYCYNLRAQSS